MVVAGTGDAARIAGVIDFGDAIYTTRVSEVAIAAAYAMQRKDAPVEALTAVVRGYHGVVPLTGAEIATLYPLAVTRLALNATVWTARRHGDTADYGRARSSTPGTRWAGSRGRTPKPWRPSCTRHCGDGRRHDRTG